MPPRTTKWTLEPHTIGKHRVLKNYLDAWLPIRTRWNGQILFIDAFAGPGEYAKGQPGSPVIALKTLLEHRGMKSNRNSVKYLFIEKEKDRCDHLAQVLSRFDNQLPPQYTYEIINSTFDHTLTSVLDKIEQQNASLAPSLVLIDPFGFSETPMRVIKRIFNNSQSEVYVSFMYRDMNRFKKQTSLEQNLDELFGCHDWYEGIDIPDNHDRKEFFYNLYTSQLKKNGAQYVIRFELYEGEQLVYAIFFGTKNLEGCDKMKQAIWKVAPFGDFKFRSGDMNKLTLGEIGVDIPAFSQSLYKQFGSQKWQRIEDIEEFVKSDATPFHSGHLKKRTLRPMEANNEIQVKRPKGRLKGFFGPDTQVLFQKSESNR